MKASRPGGRFGIPFERDSILSGITEDLRRTVGQEVEWWRWDSADTEVDDVYDVGSEAGGRIWHQGIIIPCIDVNLYHGVTLQDERGFYNTDVLRITLNMQDVERHLATMPANPDDYLRDRIVFRNQVYRPTHFYPRGQITDQYTLFTLDASQENPEEMINDSQFIKYAN